MQFISQKPKPVAMFVALAASALSVSVASRASEPVTAEFSCFSYFNHDTTGRVMGSIRIDGDLLRGRAVLKAPGEQADPKNISLMGNLLSAERGPYQVKGLDSYEG